MKKLSLLLIAFVMVFTMAACGTKDDDDGDDKDKQSKTSETTEDVTYKDVYKAQLEKLIEEHGEYTSNGAGVKYAQLIEMNNDDTPELMVIHDMVVELYQFMDNEAKLKYEGKVGLKYGQTDTSYDVVVNDTLDTPVVIVYNSEEEWTEEKFDAVTMEGNDAEVNKYSAKTDGENSTPDREELESFAINGTTVTASAYNDAYEDFMFGATIIDPYNADASKADWYDNEFIAGTKEQLEEFMDSLSK